MKLLVSFRAPVFAGEAYFFGSCLKIIVSHLSFKAVLLKDFGRSYRRGCSCCLGCNSL